MRTSRLQRVLVCALPLVFGTAGFAQEAPSGAAASVDIGSTSANPFRLELIGNFSRLPAFISVFDSADLAAKRRDPGYPRKLAALLKAKYPYAHRARVGNLFFGYTCAGLHFRELATRDASGALHFDFDEVIAMLDIVVAAGFKPMLALTGTPAAMVPQGEETVSDPAYGCVNGPVIDWSKAAVRERAREWWDLQRAFFEALVQHFGVAELRQWEFATWTEPYDPQRRTRSHLYYSTSYVPEGRYEEAVATVIAASIDAAMASGVPIHIGNFAGDLSGYPKVVMAIRQMPRGDEYLSYLSGFAVSRYRTQPRMHIAQMVSAAARLQTDARMIRKPLFIDEIGQLADDTGATPPNGTPGLESAAFIAPALHEAFASQLSGLPGVQRLAIWDSTIAARHAAALEDPKLLIPSAMQNVIAMYSRLNGLQGVLVNGGSIPMLAARTRAGVYIVASAPSNGRLCDAGAELSERIVVKGLEPGARYEALLRKIEAKAGNPISAFLNDRPSYQCGDPQFAHDEQRWFFSSANSERCFFEDGQACSWRRVAATRSAPAEERWQLTADGRGSVVLHLIVAPGATASMELRSRSENWSRLTENASMRRHLFIHVGPAKTGTTAVQAALRNYGGDDLLYPRVGLWSDGAHHNLVLNFFQDYARPEAERSDPTALLSQIAELAASHKGNLLVSSEGLAHRDVGAFASALLEALRPKGDWDAQVIYVCRDHFARAASLYNQNVKDSVLRETTGPDEYLKRSVTHLCYAPTLYRLKGFGLPVLAMNYHPSETFAPRFFSHVGISAWRELANESRNVSLSTKGLIALLAANRVAKSADDRARYFATLRGLRKMYASSPDIFSPAAKAEANQIFENDRAALLDEFGLELPEPKNLDAPSRFAITRSELEEISSLLAKLGDEGLPVLEAARPYVAP